MNCRKSHDDSGTIRALHFAAGARMPEYLTRCALGAGTSATSFSSNSTGSNTTCVVPSRQARLKRYSSRPSARRSRRSIAIGGRAQYRIRSDVPIADGLRQPRRHSRVGWSQTPWRSVDWPKPRCSPDRSDLPCGLRGAQHGGQMRLVQTQRQRRGRPATADRARADRTLPDRCRVPGRDDAEISECAQPETRSAARSLHHRGRAEPDGLLA